MNPVFARTLRSLQRNILAGIITIGPLFVTYLIFSFLLGLLASAGLPLAKLLAVIFPDEGLSQPWLQYVLAVVLTLVVLYLVGRITSQCWDGSFSIFLKRCCSTAFCRQDLHVGSATDRHHDGQEGIESAGGADRLSDAGQKTIGFLTRMMTDAGSGEILAAVYVPTAINPTAGFLQIVPFRSLTETDLTMEQAMSLLLTGGAVGPDVIRYSAPVIPLDPDLAGPIASTDLDPRQGENLAA